MPYASDATIVDFNPYKTSTVQDHTLGTSFRDGEDVYRYAKVGASTITRGKLQTAPAPKTNHHNLAVTAAALGDKTITVTLGNTAAVADEYAEGYIVLNDATLGGHQYKIKTHPAASGLATLVVTLYEPVQVVALTTSSKANLVHNTYNGIIEGTSQTVRAAGVSQVTATTGLFIWVKTRGVASLLADQAISLGAFIAPSTSVSGSVIEVSTTYATAEKTNVIGQATVMAGVDTEKRPVRLEIE